MENTLLDVEVLALFFYNYSQEDIIELCNDFEFQHFWESKRFSFSDDSNIQLWLGFSGYLNNPTRMKILELARKRYKAEVLRKYK